MSNARESVSTLVGEGVLWKRLPLYHLFLFKLSGSLSTGKAIWKAILVYICRLTDMLRGLSPHLQMQILRPRINKGHSQLCSSFIFFMLAGGASSVHVKTSSISLPFKTHGVNYMLINIFSHLHLLCFSTSAGIHISSYKKAIWPRFSLWDKMFQLSHADFLHFFFFGTSDFLNDNRDLSSLSC